MLGAHPSLLHANHLVKSGSRLPILSAGPWLPSKLQKITALWPNYTAWQKRHICEQLAEVITWKQIGQQGVKPASSDILTITPYHTVVSPKKMTVKQNLRKDGEKWHGKETGCKETGNYTPGLTVVSSAGCRPCKHA